MLFANLYVSFKIHLRSLYDPRQKNKTKKRAVHAFRVNALSTGLAISSLLQRATARDPKSLHADDMGISRVPDMVFF